MTASREGLITSILSCSIAQELQPLMRLPKQAVSYTSLVVATKHSKDLSATEDKFREREQLCIEDMLGCQEWRCWRRWGWGVGGIPHHSECPQPNPGGITLPAFHHILLSQKLDLLLQRDAPFPFQVTSASARSKPVEALLWDSRHTARGRHPGTGGTWRCPSDPAVKLDCWPFMTPWVGKHQWSWMVTCHSESC